MTPPSVSAPAAQLIRISLGQRASDAQPTLVECTVDQFIQWICDHQRGPGNKDGSYVCLADFNGQRRALENLRASYGLPLDFDGTVSEAVIRQKLTGRKYVAHTTYGHTAGAERWRVLIPTSVPMDSATHKSTWATLNALFDGAADPAASDASRLNYLPLACVDPSAARCFRGEGALLQPTPAAPPAPVSERGDGPVQGWAGPTDDTELLTIACHTRLKPDERFGGPVHFAMLWTADEGWLAQRFPGSNGQRWDYTRADAELANELLYMTGGDIERSANLMRQSGLAAVRVGDDDWANRKVYAALDLGMKGRGPDQYHFMGAPVVPAGTPAAPAISAQDATLANVPQGKQATMADYFAFMPDHTYIHRPSGKRFSAASVDEEIGKDARQILVPTVPVHSLTWAPGMPERFTLDDLDPTHVGGERVWLYNEYRAPKPPTQAGDVSRWLNLVQRLYPDDADHIVNYFADAVQFPQFKCNHALVLGSTVHGIGKDTLLAPLEHAVGSKNFKALKPTALGESFNPWVRSVVVQISESRDLGDGLNSLSRYEMYERCKDLAAAPPRSLECNEKYKGQYPVANVLRLILTTNHATDGLYMDPNDRRHYCAWSDAEKMTEAEAMAIWEWYAAGGKDHVAHYLHTLDLSARGFNRTAPPLRTAWWHQLVASGASVEEERFSDALDKLGRPEWVTMPQIAEAGGTELAGWIAHPGNRRKVEREMVKSGYQRLPNPDEARGRWYVNKIRHTVYRRSDVSAKTVAALLTKNGGGGSA